jgi:hypothetical protein
VCGAIALRHESRPGGIIDTCSPGSGTANVIKVLLLVHTATKQSTWSILLLAALL